MITFSASYFLKFLFYSRARARTFYYIGEYLGKIRDTEVDLTPSYTGALPIGCLPAIDDRPALPTLRVVLPRAPAQSPQRVCALGRGRVSSMAFSQKPNLRAYRKRMSPFGKTEHALLSHSIALCKHGTCQRFDHTNSPRTRPVRGTALRHRLYAL